MLGTKGRCDINVWNHHEIKGEKNWRWENEHSKKDKNNMYQTEHDELFASIRNGNPMNDDTDGDSIPIELSFRFLFILITIK